MSYRVILTASRSWTDLQSIWRRLDRLHRAHPDMVLVHGAALNGGDVIGDAWAKVRGVECDRYPVFPAQWRHHGRGAGPRRNARMVADGADECLAFIRDASRGATDCADKAEAAGIPTTRVLWEDRL